MNQIESLVILNRIAKAYSAKVDIERGNAVYTLPFTVKENLQVLANCFYLEAINHGAVNTDEIETKGNKVIVTFKRKEITPISPNFENSAISELCRNFNRHN